MIKVWIKKLTGNSKEEVHTAVIRELPDVAALPVYAYKGDVFVIDAPNKVNEAVDKLTCFRELGFDTETKPSFKKGEFHNVSLLQLASDEGVYLFRLHKCGFSLALRNLLSDKRIKKTGVGIRDDIKALKRLGEFTPGAFVDLQTVAEEYGIPEKSFSKLMTRIFNVKISKRQQVSNWENHALTEAQIRYAATDAWGSLMMYRELHQRWKKVAE